MSVVNSVGFRHVLDGRRGNAYIRKLMAPNKRDKSAWFDRWYKESGEFGEVYPSQGLLKTPYDYLDYVGKTLLSEEELAETLVVRRYMLEIFNHPERLKALDKVEKAGFLPPPAAESEVMEYAASSGLALAIGDLGARVVGTARKRVSRRKLLLDGPFVCLGRYGRIPFSAGAMPDVFGAPAAIAAMASCHALACVPRNGPFSELARQVDLVKAAFEWMDAEQLLEGRKDREELVKRWRRNVVGVVEPELVSGMRRVRALYSAGVRVFRVYSPEPGMDAGKLVKRIRTKYGRKVEIFAGQVATVEQGQKLEEAGADGLYLGIGGGGRCITAVRSGSVVDWPNLAWRLRGKVGIPILVEGGASDHIGVSLLLGVSGIGVSRIAAGGTIESPGGLLYLVDKKGTWFKPYGGEASARTKYLDKKVLGCGIPAFVEGETSRALRSYVPYVKPTVVENVYLLLEDLILSLVFRGVKSVAELHGLSPSPIRRVTTAGQRQQGVH